MKQGILDVGTQGPALRTLPDHGYRESNQQQDSSTNV